MTVKVCVGGTFNAIHEGHIALLTRAFLEGDEVFVGLTSDRMARKGRKVKVLGYRERLGNLSKALAGISGGKPFTVFEINDEFGPAASGDFDAIVVSEETSGTAKRINEARKKAHLKQLRTVVIPMVLGRDGNRISSTGVIEARGGEHNS